MAETDRRVVAARQGGQGVRLAAGRCCRRDGVAVNGRGQAQAQAQAATAGPGGPIPVAFLGRTSNERLQEPIASMRRQVRKSRALLPAGCQIVAYYWDVESGGDDLEDRGQKDTWRVAAAAGIPRDGGVADLLSEARSPAPGRPGRSHPRWARRRPHPPGRATEPGRHPHRRPARPDRTAPRRLRRPGRLQPGQTPGHHPRHHHRRHPPSPPRPASRPPRRPQHPTSIRPRDGPSRSRQPFDR